MNIIYGKQQKAKKVVVYGPEGIGKSTFASKFPFPVFCDTEGSTAELDVARTPRPTSFSMLKEQVKYFIAHPNELSTFVLDTADWAERMIVEEICAKAQLNGIEDFGYGKGYVYVYEEFGKLLNLLQELVDKGVHVVITAHAQMRKFEQPDEMGAYDRWELKLGKKTSSQTAPLLKEWADAVLFVNYKTYVVNVDNQGAAKGKNKAQGGKRVMYTTHHSCWDAKNRWGLPEEMPFDFSGLEHIFTDFKKPNINPAAPVTPPAAPELPKRELAEAVEEITSLEEIEDRFLSQPTIEGGPTGNAVEGLPRALLDLMKKDNVAEHEIQLAVALKGYYPNDTPISKYDPNFITGVLIGAWPQVFEMVKQNREENPFK